MRATAVIGPVTGTDHAAYATGEASNGSPVLAFTAEQIRALIGAGDGADANGYGLALQGDRIIDVTGPGESGDVPTITSEINGVSHVLYVPDGRQWIDSSLNSTITVARYDEEDRCLACGEHLADPHAPRCPTAMATELRESAATNDEAHAATVPASSGTPALCPAASACGDPAEVSHHFIAVTQRMSADLIEMDHTGAIDLDRWPEAAEFVAFVTGEADQWRT